MRDVRTYQDVRRCAHTGGVNEGSLTSLAPDSDKVNGPYLYSAFLV